MNGLIETLDSLINDENYSNVKIIITTRPASISREIIDMQANGIEIIPFNGDQVTKFFKSYGLPEEYNFDNIKNFQLSSEIICTPLFCWMFAYIVMTSGQNRLFDYDLSKNVLTTKLYQKFFYSIIRGKLMAKEYHNWLQQFLEEKKILRRVAALWYLKYPDLVDSYLIKGLIALGMEELGSDTETERKEKLKLIEPFITAYFYRLGKYRPEKKIDFMHKSFGEFLLAEFFIESFITNRKYYLEITIPNEETINYFEGLLNLLNDENIVTHKNGQPDNMQLFLDSVPSPASDSMQVEGLHHRGIVVENAEKFFKEDSIILRIDKNKYKEINDYKNNANVDLHWEIAEITSYPRLYVHRWLSVFLLNILSPEKLTDDTEKKQKLVDLIKLTSRLMPNYLLRLSQVNLSQTEEFRADLSGADLSNANLSQAKLFYANLYDAKLSGADLHDVKLIHADLHDADLSGADLHDAELIHADLHDADLSSADLSNADLSSADLSNADLHYANLSGAKFINTDLSNADLYDADLSGANFFNAKNLPISSEEIRNRGGIFDS
jgi:hypothetical protein